MNARIDDLVETLASTPADRSLDGFEYEVGRRIARGRLEARTRSAIAPVRIAAVAVGLLVGVTAGGFAAASSFETARQHNTLSVSALAPSTLLEGAE